MAEGQFILYIRKVVVNPLLGRRQCAVELIHPEMAGVTKAVIKTHLAKKFKCVGQEDRIAVFGLRAKFGGGRSSGFATIYDDVDTRKKYDTKSNCVRVSSQGPSNASQRTRSGRAAGVVFGAFLSFVQIYNYYFNRTASSRSPRR